MADNHNYEWPDGRIRLTIKQRKDLYTELYKQLLYLVALYNPCNIKKNCMNQTTCSGSRDNNERINVLCCSYCKHHSKKNGCKVQSLSCTLWYCDVAWRNIHSMAPHNIEEFTRVREFVLQQMRTHEVPAFPRCSKSENFKSK